MANRPIEVVEIVASSLQGHGDVGSDEASGAGDEDGEAGVGATVSRMSDVALPVGAAIGAERSARVGARRRREKEKVHQKKNREGKRSRDQREKKRHLRVVFFFFFFEVPVVAVGVCAGGGRR